MKPTLSKREEIEEATLELNGALIEEMEAHDAVKENQLKVQAAHTRVLRAKDTIRSLTIN